MMQAAEVRTCDNVPRVSSLIGSMIWRIPLQRLARASATFVAAPTLIGFFETSLVQRDQVFQTLLAHAADPPLHAGILPGARGAIGNSSVPWPRT
jgi:hypothetical protein